MKKAVWSGILAVAGVLALSDMAFAQAATANAAVAVSAAVNPKAKLTLGAANISFTDTSNPDDAPFLDATPFSVEVKSRSSAAGNVTLTVRATGNLTSGANSIGIANLTWLADGDLVAGTSSSASEISVGSWTGSGTRTGNQTYRLANSWAYAIGNYTVTLNYTLTAP